MNLTRREIVLIGALITTIIVAAVVVMVFTYTIHNTGRVVTIGLAAYWDPAGTKLCTSIDWGTMTPSSMTGVTIYLKNTQALNATLSMNSSNWQPPEIQQYFTLAWNYSGAILQPSQMIAVQITLTVSSEIKNSTNFSYDMNLYATEA